jgi:GT2 family glycosyltransferase
MDLSIIIVNWNSAEYVKNCLRSLFANDKGTDFEVIVVDNGSFDSCGRMIGDDFPPVRFLQSDENLGFAKANNLGAENALGQFLLFLNPDTEVIGNAVAAMLSAIKSLPKAGIIGGKLLNSDMTLQTSCIQPFPTLLNQVLDADVLHRRFPGLSMWGISPLFQDTADPVEAEVISGACLMIGKQVFEEVGGFSPEYFMYTEDIDLCYKVRRADYKNYYTAAASIIHHGGGSSLQRKENSYANVQMRESVSRFLKKTRGGLYAFIYRGAMLFSGIIRSFMLSLAFIPCVLTGRSARCAASLTKWTGIIRWALGIEKWAR